MLLSFSRPPSSLSMLASRSACFFVSRLWYRAICVCVWGGGGGGVSGVLRYTLTHTHQFQKALGCGVVVPPLIGEIDLAYLVDAAVNEGHVMTDGAADLI